MGISKLQQNERVFFKILDLLKKKKKNMQRRSDVPNKMFVSRTWQKFADLSFKGLAQASRLVICIKVSVKKTVLHSGEISDLILKLYERNDSIMHF